jgi:hypothetical protein
LIGGNVLEDGRLKMQLPPQLAEMLNRLAKAAGLTPEGWIRAAIVAHGGKLAQNTSQKPQEPRWDEIIP